MSRKNHGAASIEDQISELNTPDRLKLIKFAFSFITDGGYTCDHDNRGDKSIIVISNNRFKIDMEIEGWIEDLRPDGNEIIINGKNFSTWLQEFTHINGVSEYLEKSESLLNTDYLTENKTALSTPHISQSFGKISIGEPKAPIKSRELEKPAASSRHKNSLFSLQGEFKKDDGSILRSFKWKTIDLSNPRAMFDKSMMQQIVPAGSVVERALNQKTIKFGRHILTLEGDGPFEQSFTSDMQITINGRLIPEFLEEFRDKVEGVAEYLDTLSPSEKIAPYRVA